MSRKTLWYLSFAAICLAPVAAAAEDPAIDEGATKTQVAADEQKGQDEAAPEEKKGGEDQGGGGFTLEGAPAGEEFGVTEAAPPPPWETQAEIEYSSEIEAGILYNSTDSFKHGEYTGLTDQAPYGIGNFDVRMRSPYDGKDTDYVQMEGTNLGLDSREVRIEGGRQGSFKGYIDYDQIPKFFSDSAQTPFLDAGSNFQKLPSNWVASGTTTGMTNLIADLNDIDLSYERKQLGGGFSYIPAPHWEFRTDFQHEWKNGMKSVGAVIGNSGGNPRSVLLAEPIDYNTDQATVTLAYADQRMQGELSYYVSLFNDQNNSLTWQNPYSAITGWDADAGYPALGRLGLPPDNQFHQINFSGGYNIDMETSTRANLDVSYGWMLQDQTFLPYTVNEKLLVPNALPRTSLDGEINTTLVNFRLTSHPLPKVHLRGGYRYDDRDNQTPINLYDYIGGDSTDQVTNVAMDRFRYNRPYSYTQHKVDVEGDYDILPHTTGTLGYEFENIHRTFSEVEDTDEHTASARVKTAPVDFATVTLKGAYGIRNGSGYDFELPEEETFTPQYLVTNPLGMAPLMRKFYEANRTRVRFGGDVRFTPLDTVSVGLRSDYIRDHYWASPLGLRDREDDTYTADVSYTPIEEVTTYAFYTLNFVWTEQSNRSFSTQGQQNDANRNWFVTESDTIDTAGVGVDWKAIKDKLDLNFDYTYSRADTAYDQASALARSDLPSIKTELHSVGVLGTYHFRKDIALKLGYRFETYRTYDWALDGVAVNTISNVLTMGDVSPDYTAHVAAASVAFKF
jgi:MtrB/PioB family decaheme-associated outer membrane protein